MIEAYLLDPNNFDFDPDDLLSAEELVAALEEDMAYVDVDETEDDDDVDYINIEDLK